MIEGECFCGKMRYRIDGTLTDARSCHCSRCRKAFSGPCSAYAIVADGSRFEWVEGAEHLKTYVGEHGWGVGFCSVCGSTLCGVFKDTVHGVALGSVNGDPNVQIERHIFVGSKAPWDDHIGGAPQFDGFPPQD